MYWLFTECTRSGLPSSEGGEGEGRGGLDWSICRYFFDRVCHLRRAETPSELLLVTDLWDRSARNLLDDRKRRIKVA